MGRKTNVIPIRPRGNHKHAVFAVARGPGLAAVPAALHDRQLQVAEHLATREGALCELEQQALLQVMICECGTAHIREVIESGRNPWTVRDGEPDSILKYLQSWSNGAGRLLIALAQLRGDRNTIDLAEMLRKGVKELERNASDADTSDVAE
jgi:hypothetical protein